MNTMNEKEAAIEEVEVGEQEKAPEKKSSMDTLIEKGKKGKLSASDLDEALEEMNFDVDSIDKLYETLEDNGIVFAGEISTEEMNEIESEVEKFGAGENMERVLEQEEIGRAHV